MKYLISVTIALLCSCSATPYYYATRLPYKGYAYDEYEGYYGPGGASYYGDQEGFYQRGYGGRQVEQIRVPNSYHVGRYRSPETPYSRDERWVNSQYSGGYTIQISRGNKASRVAKDLMRAPKNNRTAAVRSQGGYVGVYGTYSSYEDAKRAFETLPPDLRSKARVKSWGSVR